MVDGLKQLMVAEETKLRIPVQGRREAEGGGGLLLGLVEKADRVENLGVTQGMIQKSRDIFCQ